jgi:hypothetical protein
MCNYKLPRGKAFSVHACTELNDCYFLVATYYIRVCMGVAMEAELADIK